MADFTALKNSIRNYIKQNGNAEITGEVLQNILISMVVSMGDGAINGIADGLANEGNARTNADGLLQNAINSISTALGDGYTYAGIATPATTPTSGRVFYLALQAGTYTNFGGIVVTQGINILKNNDGTWQLDNVIGIDDIPTAGSPNLVKSGGAFANMGAFDISDYNKSGSTLATYADLTAALAALPSEYQKGGMSVKFIQSSDNKYVQYFLTKNDWSANEADWVSKANLVKEVTSRNLFNKDDLINGYIASSNGEIDEATNPRYKVSNIIPVVGGEIYYVTFPTGVSWHGARFVDSNNNPLKAQTISGTDMAWDIGLSRAVKAPSTAVGFQFQVKFDDNPYLDTAQFELGDTPTEHVPYSFKMVLDENELPQAFTNLEQRVTNLEVGDTSNLLHLELDNNVESYIISSLNSINNIKQTIFINNTNENHTFNFRYVYLVNKQNLSETLIKDCSDDIAPVNFSTGSYLGGNHGANCLNKISASHNKTFVDIGSIWSNGTNNFTLVKVESNYLYFVGENILEYPSFSFASMETSGTLTHVSGATNTEDIVYSNKVLTQWWPFYKDVPQKSIYINGKEITENGDYYFNELKISEYYDVLNPASVLSKVQEGVGSFSTNPTPQDFSYSADSLMRISSVYTFKSASECFVAMNLCLYQETSTFNFSCFTQSSNLAGNNQKIYIPKAKSKNNGGTVVNYRTVANMDDASGLIRAYDYEVPNMPPDRILVMDDNIGLHVGYLFDYGVGGNNRLASLTGSTAMEISGSKKLYPYGWGVPPASLSSAYSNKSAVCFRKYIDRASINTNGVISISVFEYNNKCYIYADFNAAGNYEIEIPSKYQGGQIEVLEKRDNVELLTQNASEKILIHVSQDDVMYGYFVGRIY